MVALVVDVVIVVGAIVVDDAGGVVEVVKGPVVVVSSIATAVVTVVGDDEKNDDDVAVVDVVDVDVDVALVTARLEVFAVTALVDIVVALGTLKASIADVGCAVVVITGNTVDVVGAVDFITSFVASDLEVVDDLGGVEIDAVVLKLVLDVVHCVVLELTVVAGSVGETIVVAVDDCIRAVILFVDVVCSAMFLVVGDLDVTMVNGRVVAVTRFVVLKAPVA